MDSAGGATGLAGGNALPQDWDELVYKDLGYVTNTRTVMPGWTGPQTPKNVLATNPLSTTSGSNVVTVTLASHGFTTGDDVALGNTAIPVVTTSGIPGRALTGAHIITVVDANTFTFVTSDVGINFNATEGGHNGSPTFTSPNATATASGVGGVIRITNRSQWRDMWLEQSVATIVAAQAAKKRTSKGDPEHKARKEARKERLLKQRREQATRKKRAFNVHEAKKLYGRDVSCHYTGTSSSSKRDGVLTRPSEMPATRTITLPRFDPEGGSGVSQFEYDQLLSKALNEVATAVKAELASGGMCLNSDGALMATPKCSQLVKIVPAKARAHAGYVAPSSKKHIDTKNTATYNACIKACGTNATPGYRQCITKCSPTIRT